MFVSLHPGKISHLCQKLCVVVYPTVADSRGPEEEDPDEEVTEEEDDDDDDDDWTCAWTNAGNVKLLG